MHRPLRLLATLAFLLLIGAIHALDVTITIIATENCDYGNGKLRANVTGGTPPYTYAWSNGSTQQIPTMLSSGTYSVVVSDSQGEQGSASIFLPSGPFLESDLAVTMTFQGLPYCAGMNPAGPLFNFRQDAWFMFAGEAPYTFDGLVGQEWLCNSAVAGYLAPLAGAQDGEVVQVAFQDANGCPGTITVTTGYEIEWPLISISNVQAACNGQSNGSAQVYFGPEGHGQTVWVQLLDANDNVIFGSTWNFSVGAAPVGLNLNSLAAGTYRVVMHFVNDPCSPLFGQCTTEQELVIPAETECLCQNNTQFPNEAVLITSQGAEQFVSGCMFFGEYSRFTNVQAGGTYLFTITNNGYITVREGYPGGPVLAHGASPLQVTSTSGDELFVHYNADATCATGTTCQTTTVTRVLNCIMPQATFLAEVDCATGLYTVTVNVLNTGDASGVDIAVLGGSPVHADVGPGSYPMGPFTSLDGVGIVVAHGEDPDCTVGNSAWQVIECPEEVSCGGAPVLETYCYGSNDLRQWSYVAEGQGTLYLRFLRGTIESSNFDELRIHDGLDSSAPLLFTHNGGTQNLGPAGSAITGVNFPYAAVEVFSTTGSLYMEMSSDMSVNCGSTNNFDAWEWEVVCGTVSLSGRAFMDEDLDCAWNAAEIPVPQTIIEVLPGPHYATTQANGQYFMVLNEGAYTISQINPYVVDHCADTPQPFVVFGSGSSVTIDFPDTAATALDLAVSMSSGPARLGFSYQQAVAVQNLSARPSGPITLTMAVPAVLLYQEAIPAPSTLDGTTLTWELPALGAFQQHSLQLHYHVPVNTDLIGMVTSTTATVSNTLTEETLANNSATHLRTITAAYDPNDKIATTSSGASGSSFYLDLDEWIDYTIRFQNTGNDTAFTVVITDTLPSALDPTTIQMGAASHPFTWELKGPGILEFTFNNILLPDSFVNEPASHGFVGFRIRPHLPVLLGEEIINIANIYFDFNPPVITEPSVLVAEFWTGVENHTPERTGLLPNPATDRIRLADALSATSARSWSIIAMDGRVVRSEHGPFPSDGISIASLRTGTYALRLQLDHGILTERFIKTAHE